MRTVAATALMLVATVTGCGVYAPSADVVMQQKQEKLQSEAVKEVGTPNITRFTELKRFAYLYELRDRSDLTCWVYTRDMVGAMHLIGVGMGFPMPYGTQFSSPQKITNTYLPSMGGDGAVKGTGWYTGPMPQAEPNGLFMPPGAEASWVILMTRRGPKPYYGETRLEGSPERLATADESMAIWPNGEPIPKTVMEPPVASDVDQRAVEKQK